MVLPVLGRIDEANALLDAALEAVRVTRNPTFIAYAMLGQARTMRESEPDRAAEVLRKCLDYCREHRLVFLRSYAASEAASLEAVQGAPDVALDLFAAAIEQFDRSGNQVSLAMTLAQLAAYLAEAGESAGAVTLVG